MLAYQPNAANQMATTAGNFTMSSANFNMVVVYHGMYCGTLLNITVYHGTLTYHGTLLNTTVYIGTLFLAVPGTLLNTKVYIGTLFLAVPSPNKYIAYLH